MFEISKGQWLSFLVLVGFIGWAAIEAFIWLIGFLMKHLQWV